MAELSLAELEEIMRESTGDDEPVGTADGRTRTFEELGYDSLAVLEIVNRIERTYGVKLPEDRLEAVRTPEALVGFVNERLREAV
ncbi:acyl carrier protein [Streptomyces sp. NPDC047928]|uniref:acyl carrier protein n=1 Tax=unclassified Streptomyces TaxID=2593676 RepID=UPI00371593EA